MVKATEYRFDAQASETAESSNATARPFSRRHRDSAQNEISKKAESEQSSQGDRAKAVEDLG